MIRNKWAFHNKGTGSNIVILQVPNSRNHKQIEKKYIKNRFDVINFDIIDLNVINIRLQTLIQCTTKTY